MAHFGSKDEAKMEWCVLHKKENDVFVINNQCEHTDCLKYPSFGSLATREVLFCKEHKQTVDVEIEAVLSKDLQKAALRQYELNTGPPLLRECDKLATCKQGKLLSTTFNARRKQEYQCVREHCFALKLQALRAGNWCPECILLESAAHAALFELEARQCSKQRAEQQPRSAPSCPPLEHSRCVIHVGIGNSEHGQQQIEKGTQVGVVQAGVVATLPGAETFVKVGTPKLKRPVQQVGPGSKGSRKSSEHTKIHKQMPPLDPYWMLQ